MPYRNMNDQRFWSLLLSAALMLCSLPVLAAPAAHVEFFTGAVSIANKQNQMRPAEKAMALDEGDTVITNDGRAQIRFSDGGYFSLQPQTQFRVDEYHYSEGHDKDDHVFVSLLKGGLRTISGLIGKRSHAAYRMTTTVATIGIRGTEYALDVNSTLYGHVSQGAIEVCNGAGCLTVPGGQAFFVSSPSTLPIFTEKRSVLAPPSQPVTAATPFKSGNSSESAGRGATVSKGSIADAAPANFTLPATVVVQVGNASTAQQPGLQAGAQLTQVSQIATTVSTVGNQVVTPVGNVVSNVTAPITNTIGTVVGTTVPTVTNTLGTVVGTTSPAVGAVTNPLVNQVPVIGTTLNGLLR